MSSRAIGWAGRIVALFAALVWGFFVAFNVVFSDVFGARAMAGAVLFVLLAYGLLGVAFGAAGPRTGWRWMWWLSVPGVLVVALGVFDSAERALYHSAVILAIAGGSATGGWAGAKAGSWLRARLSRGRATP